MGVTNAGGGNITVTDGGRVLVSGNVCDVCVANEGIASVLLNPIVTFNATGARSRIDMSENRVNGGKAVFGATAIAIFPSRVPSSALAVDFGALVNVSCNSVVGVEESLVFNLPGSTPPFFAAAVNITVEDFAVGLNGAVFMEHNSVVDVKARLKGLGRVAAAVALSGGHVYVSADALVSIAHSTAVKMTASEVFAVRFEGKNVNVAGDLRIGNSLLTNPTFTTSVAAVRIQSVGNFSTEGSGTVSLSNNSAFSVNPASTPTVTPPPSSTTSSVVVLIVRGDLNLGDSTGIGTLPALAIFNNSLDEVSVGELSPWTAIKVSVGGVTNGGERSSVVVFGNRASDVSIVGPSSFSMVHINSSGRFSLGSASVFAVSNNTVSTVRGTAASAISLFSIETSDELALQVGATLSIDGNSATDISVEGALDILRLAFSSSATAGSDSIISICRNTVENGRSLKGAARGVALLHTAASGRLTTAGAITISNNAIDIGSGTGESCPSAGIVVTPAVVADGAAIKSSSLRIDGNSRPTDVL